ncbi:MAG: hypothetical protein RL141_66 [Candidatus Parcubacteria bacterium]|jgi:hypothetical protein
MGKRKRLKHTSAVDDASRPTPPPGFASESVDEIEPADDVTAGLAAIYGKGAKEARAELSSLDAGGRRRPFLVAIVAVFGTIACLTAIAWAGFWWWSGHTRASGLEIAIEGPSDVAIGAETTFTVRWKNPSPDPLAALELRLAFPNDFVIRQVEPAAGSGASDATSSVIRRLGSQAGNAQGAIVVVGTFTGALGTESAVQVIGTYRPATFNSEFETLATHALNYGSSVLVGRVDVPLKVLPGDDVTIRYHVMNQGDTAMEGLEARIRLPEGFVRDATGTGSVLDDPVVRLALPTVAPHSTSTVAVTGSFALGAHGDSIVKAEAGRVGVDGTFSAAQRAEGILSVLAGDMSIQLVMNGSSVGRSVSLGERQRISVAYQNMSGEELRDIELRFHFGAEAASVPAGADAPALVDWDELDDPNTGTRRGNTITYTQEELPAFERLAPEEDGVVEFSVPLVSTLPDGPEIPLVAYVEAVIGSVDGVRVDRIVATQPILLRLQTDAAVDALARYASEEGAPVGSGPLPPTVGTSTTYRVEWHIAKTLHALDRVTISANLPKGTAWGGQKEVQAGDIRYDADRRLVTWTVNKLPQDINDAIASFDVTLTPSEADAGRFASLLGETRFEFTDAALGESLLRTAPSLTTDLGDDELARGKGVVKKP